MKTNSGLRIFFICLLMIGLLASLTSCMTSAAAANTPRTFTGIVIDEHCFQKKPDPTLDSKKCLQMTACAATGYGIAVLQSDNTYKFYYFDGEFAPAATGAQLTAINLIDASTKTDHFYVSVTGTLTGENRKAADGQSYPLLKVDSLAESNG